MVTHDTKRKKKLGLRGLFHSKVSPVEEDAEISFASLKKMATTRDQEDILKLIEHETIPTVRDAWIDYFLKITKRSKCKGD